MTLKLNYSPTIVVLRVLSAIGFGLHSEDWIKCESDWLNEREEGIE